VRARDMVREVTLKTGETIGMPGNPVKLSAVEDPAYTCPPSLGEHTDNVLRDLLGYDANQVAALRADGAIG